jgi:hypothetical protein
MKDVLAQIRQALGADLYYLALFTALTMPDICGAIDAEDGNASPRKYAEWFDKYVAPKYEGFLTGEDCYAFRCSLLHQGTLRSHKGQYSRLIFVEPSATTNVFHNNILNDALNIDIRIFCNDIIAGAIQWLNEVEDTERFKTNFEKCVRRHPEGLSPYIVGVPVIG